MSSYSYSESFTRLHARKLAGRVTADLHQCHIMYDAPSADMVTKYQAELEELLVENYVQRYEFGFERDGQLVMAMRYTVGPDGGLVADGRSGGIPRVDVSKATFFNLLTPSRSWVLLSNQQRQSLEARLPFTRSAGTLPSASGGYWTTDRGYTAGGVLVNRDVYRRSA